jgi:ubiquinone/menaquinone biosynthesis C-methylase UbiE
MKANMKRQQRDWNEVAKLKSSFAICERGRFFRGCPHPGIETSQTEGHSVNDLDGLWESGRDQIHEAMAYLNKRAPDLQFDAALDFGCGVGRSTVPLSEYWSHVIGVDVSNEMVSMANSHHAENTRCKFIVNARPDLGCFDDESFDFVYSTWTLAHIPDRAMIEAYVRDFVRVLRPQGYALFHLPTHLSVLQRIKVRRHIYRFLRSVGVSPHFLYYKLQLHPNRVMHVPSSRVTSWVEPQAQVVEVSSDGSIYSQYLVRKRSE